MMTSGGFGSATGPIEDVHIGMAVRDAAGAELGTVETVKIGDPGAATPQGQTAQGGGLMEDVKRAFGGGEPRLPPELAARLLRIGFVKVDGKGLFGRDLYVSAEQVARVDGDVVHLTASSEELVREL